MAKNGITVKVTEDNSKAIMRQVDTNCTAALHAMGIKAVNLILWQMQHGYGKPIRDTGDLQRDVAYEVLPEEQAVIVGNGLDYAIYVHDGTRKMTGRPYIRDALTKPTSIKQLEQVAAAYMGQGFDGA